MAARWKDQLLDAIDDLYARVAGGRKNASSGCLGPHQEGGSIGVRGFEDFEPPYARACAGARHGHALRSARRGSPFPFPVSSLTRRAGP